MDVDKVLTSFENIARIVRESSSQDLHRKTIDLLDRYPFPNLSSVEEWRKKQIRSTLEQQNLLLESKT